MAIEITEIKAFYNSLYTLNMEPGVGLEQIAKSLEASGSTKKASNSGGWQSDIQTYESIKYVQPFLDKILLLANKIYLEFNINKEAELLNYWFNTNRKHNFNWGHNHPHSFFSAIFYIKTTDKTGNLIFERPDALREWIQIAKTNEKNTDSLVFTPRDNDIIFFPSHIKHRVEQNNSDDDRMSVAFNFK